MFQLDSAFMVVKLSRIKSRLLERELVTSFAVLLAQCRMDDRMDEALRERLKSALWYAIGKIVDEESLRHGVNATPQFIGALTEMVWAQTENVAQDLESFAKHAGRSTVTTDDVLLITRRNDALHDIMKDFIDEDSASKSKKKSRRTD